MEKQVRLYPSDSFRNEYYANIAAWCHLIAKNIEVIEDNTQGTWFFKNKIFIKYEVMPNPWGIEFLEYRRGEGFIVIGKKLDLYRTPPLDYTIKI